VAGGGGGCGEGGGPQGRVVSGARLGRPARGRPIPASFHRHRTLRSVSPPRDRGRLPRRRDDRHGVAAGAAADALRLGGAARAAKHHQNVSRRGRSSALDPRAPVLRARLQIRRRPLNRTRNLYPPPFHPPTPTPPPPPPP